MKYLKFSIYTLGIAALLCGSLLTIGLFKTGHSGAASASNWKANRIIDDYNFYNGTAMSESSIQAFLNSKVPTCDTNGSVMYNGSQTRAQWAAANGRPQPPYKCLKSYTQNIPSRSADAYCSGSVGGGTKTAARIIYDVAKACNISPKVILITLQKEQSLITDDWPWPVQYTKATGMGCPDAPINPPEDDANNNGCYDDFEGFFNQIWYGARQFQLYKKNPQNYSYEAGKTGFVAYNPSGYCDGTNIKMYNHATAALYNYTPYQPNSAALSNLYGTGDSCSSYGNRNFWRMYTDWFGNPHVDTSKDRPFVGDWDGDGNETPAVRRETSYLFDNDNDGDADLTASWGRTSDELIVGDWDGDDRDEIGLKRGNIYYLDYDNNGSPNNVVTYGRSSDGVIVGDWDGDGDDELGLKRGNIYYLDYDNNGKADKKVAWGKPSDGAFIGDWDDDGADELALRRGSTYYLDYNNNGSPNKVVSWGKSSDGLIIGDWDGDGDDELGLKRGATSYLDYDKNGSPNAIISWGRVTDKLRVGDWDGDGDDELGLKRDNQYFLDYDHNGSPNELFIYTY